ncbi:MAG: deoxyguanosinetriphosphate triphosphohydrolase [Gammaproteobacteria bacterium]|nr:deoxyguanosinetriphosphate triphosphohydrolase [Gammaproteobacteria bacterium]
MDLDQQARTRVVEPWGLAPYAASERRSRGRRHAEPEHELRSAYQRDRDRVIHASSFRRLEYKTQVFVNHEGDMFRTRLTHSLEVAQIARTIARAMNANEDLTEAIALAHDLGHTPFGHAGQDSLNECMRDFGGFEHNRQSLRVVDELESRYPDFPGLNLTFETREGIIKHCRPESAEELGPVASRFITGGQPSLEAQIANQADEIAYNHHDIDDGLRSGLLTIEQVQQLDLFANHFREVARRWPAVDRKRHQYTAIRQMLNMFAMDLMRATADRIASCAPSSIDDIREQTDPLVGFSDIVAEQHVLLKQFLFEHLYRHEKVAAMSRRAAHIVKQLFASLTEEAHSSAAAGSASEIARGVADHIAGMTDRYAIHEFQRRFGHEP